jgi:predicted acetyltransferase
MNIKPNETPETWLNDTFWGDKGKIISREWVPSCMGRIIQIEKMTGLDVSEGSISVKVTDDDCEWNNGIFNFSSNEGKLEISKTEKYDIELTIQGLSAIVYGCYNLDDFEYKGWGKISEVNKTKIEALFPKMSPFLYADF